MTSHPPRLTLVAACVPASLLVSQPSAACPPCYCETPRGLRPAVDNIEVVPLNARFLVELTDHRPGQQPTTFDQNDIRWLNLDTQTPVAFDVVDTDGAAGQVWLVPAALLPADSEFALEVGPEDDSRAFRQRFRTGSTIDDSPPVAASPVVKIDDASGACGAFHGASLTWDAIQDNDGPIAYDPVVRLVVTQGAESTVLFLDARLRDSGKAVQLGAPADSDSSDCWASSAVSFYSPRESVTVTASVYDRAGNQTQLEPIELNLERNPGASCSSTEGDCSVSSQRQTAPKFLAWSVLLGSMVAVARRRRRNPFGARQRLG